MYLCFYTPKMKCIKYFVGIDQNNRNNRSFRPNRAFEAAGFKVTHFVFVVKLITAFRKQDIFHSIFYIFTHFKNNLHSLTHIIFFQSFSLYQIHKFTDQNGIGFGFIHHQGTGRGMWDHNSKRIIFSLMVRIHDIPLILWEILLTETFGLDLPGTHHERNRMAYQPVTLLFRKFFRMIRLITHTGNHIRCTK